MRHFALPETFILGTATAAVQIEGGDTANSWYRWSHQAGRIADGSTCDVADDHWNRLEEDTALMGQLHLQSARIGLEWSRIEPRREEFDGSAIEHYRRELELLKSAGIEPLVTLHHFSNPLWLEDDVTWLDDTVVSCFERYTDFVVRHLGDLVSDWVTINEPNVYLMFGYVSGIFPPGETNMRSYFRGARNMIAAHIAAYETIHQRRREMGYDDTKVGAAHHLRVFTPKTWRQPERGLCALLDRVFQEIFVTGMATGKLLLPLGRGYPFGHGDFQDFFGVNYYSRDIIAFDHRKPSTLFADIQVKEGSHRNDLGWEIFPHGLYHLCAREHARFRKPIFITENGTCDSADLFRTRYIYDHLLQVKLLLDHGIDVQRYYHWTLMDNFEWAEGLSARFGLFEVDYETQARTLRRSGAFYAELCRHRGVTQEMIERFLA